MGRAALSRRPCPFCSLVRDAERGAGLEALQALAGSRVGLTTGAVRELWEELEDLVPLRAFEPTQRLVPRLEAFGPGPIRQDDFVALEHQVDIAGLAHFHVEDARQFRQVLGGDEHFALVKEHLRGLVRQQHPVVRG